jgi:Ca2+-binding EF-hand superfamily protein
MKKDPSGTRWSVVLESLDLDGDGMVDYHEFVTAALDRKKVLTQDNL